MIFENKYFAQKKVLSKVKDSFFDYFLIKLRILNHQIIAGHFFLWNLK